MPWHIEQNHSQCPSDKPYGVVQDDNGDLMGCHATEEEAQAQLAALYANEDESNSREDVVYSYPARIMPLQGNRQGLIDIIKTQHAYQGQDLQEEDLFIFPAEISSNRLDAYYTRMHPSSLQNYAADAEAGVAFLNSHDSRRLPFGRVFTGSYEELAQDLELEPFEELPEAMKLARVRCDTYTARGLNLNQVETDHLIRGIQAGILKDVSIGFYRGFFRCTICDEDMRHWWECPHIPGFRYEVEEKDGQSTTVRIRLATAMVENAHLAEVSSVYDGATPGAVILKARCMSEAGNLPPKEAAVLEQRYRIRLPASHRNWPGIQTASKGDAPGKPQPEAGVGNLQPSALSGACSTEGAHTVDPFLTDEQKRALVALGMPEELEPEAQLRWLVEQAGRSSKRIKSLETELAAKTSELAELEQARAQLESDKTELAELADLGRSYKSDLVEAALAEGVRALGEDFAQETYRSMLESASLDFIKRMTQDWKSVGDARFPGGRQTEEESAVSVSLDSAVDNDAYRV